jgi:hypothetical protein
MRCNENGFAKVDEVREGGDRPPGKFPFYPVRMKE